MARRPIVVLSIGGCFVVVAGVCVTAVAIKRLS